MVSFAQSRPVWLVPVLFLLVFGLFLIGNRGSYHGYFQDDDLDTLSWTPNVPDSTYGKALVSPVLSPNNFRPVGHYYYHLMERWAKLRFPRWLAVLNALHFLNVVLVWMLARRAMRELRGESSVAGEVVSTEEEPTLGSRRRHWGAALPTAGAIAQKAGAEGTAGPTQTGVSAVLAWSRRTAMLPHAEIGAGAAALFFAYHASSFDGYWKPMFVFDVTCATMTLLCLVSYAYGRYVLAFLFFWCAYKSKEIAVMLPVVLAVWEYTIGGRKWWRLLPFLAVSASFGLQAVIANRGRDDAYTLRFTWAALRQTLPFYTREMLLIPFSGLLTLLLPIWFKDRRIWFALAALWVPLIPLLALPDRRFGVYLYTPLIGLSLLVGLVLMRLKPAWVAAVFAVWLPLNYWQLTKYRRVELGSAQDNRAYVQTLTDFMRKVPDTTYYYWDSMPEHMNWWGMKGTVFYHTDREDIKIERIEDVKNRADLARTPAAFLYWNQAQHTLTIERDAGSAPEASYVFMAGQRTQWRLTSGWYGQEGLIRWMQPDATAELVRTAGEKEFVLRTSVPDVLLAAGPRTVQIQLNQVGLSDWKIAQAGLQELRWPLPAKEPMGKVTVRFHVMPETRIGQDARRLGLPVAGFGFR